MDSLEQLRILDRLLAAGSISAQDYRSHRAHLVGALPGDGVERRAGAYLLEGPAGQGLYWGRHSHAAYAQAEGTVMVRLWSGASASHTAFGLEAAAMRGIRSGRVARAVALLAEGGTLGMVLSPVVGRALLVPDGGMERADAMAVLQPLALQLDSLAAKGIVLRWLHPKDIRLTGEGPVLLGLGWIREAEEGLSPTRKWLLAEARAQGIREDLMAWALLAQELLGGRREPGGTAGGDSKDLPLRLVAAAFGLPDTEALSGLELGSCQALLTAVEGLVPPSRPSRRRKPAEGVEVEGMDSVRSFQRARLRLGGQSIELVLLPGGIADLGGESVEVGQPFFLSTTAITQGLYAAVTGKRPAHFRGADHPVERVSWLDALRFCNRLSKLAGLEPFVRLTRKSLYLQDEPAGFRLPTEAEWTLGAGAGASFAYSGSDALVDVAWCDDNSGRSTHPVGRKRANGWGLHDLSGNVWEWCWDPWRPLGQAQGVRPDRLDRVDRADEPRRVCKGGSWRDGPIQLRIDARMQQGRDVLRPDLGFRIACYAW
jgi:formylglycine-generating enzyme